MNFREVVISLKYVYGFYTIPIILTASFIISQQYPNWIAMLNVSLIALLILTFFYWLIYRNVGQLLRDLVNGEIMQFANINDLIIDQQFKMLGYGLAIYGEYNGYSTQMDLHFEPKNILNQYYFTVSVFIDDSKDINHSEFFDSLKNKNVQLSGCFAHLNKKILVLKGVNLTTDLTDALNRLTDDLKTYKIKPLEINK